ncbi:TetR/AcrR family transcriptional regulator [Streptomyces sp. BBFR102]|uniref:TetR/AcrR family transcriptional regulator n=1 Tax=Streptomyces sp. BBFR102 TaxID=3448171 RepID=UPI003F539309
MTPAEEGTPPRKRYAKSAAIRQRVVDACIEAFGQSGFYGATMKDIAARAGMSHTGLLHHFPTKESLLVAVLQYRDDRNTVAWQAALERLGETPENTVRSLLAAVVANELEPGLAALHASLSAEATNPDHPAHDYFRERYQFFRTYYEARFEEMAARGHLNTSMSPRALAYTFGAMLDGLELQWLYGKGDFTMEDVFEEFLSSISPTE